MSKKERRPSHEFLSELSISQKQRLSTEKHNLQVKLDKIDYQRRKSLDVLDTERRLISDALQKQKREIYQRQREMQYRSQNPETGQASKDQEHPEHLRMPKRLEESVSRAKVGNLARRRSSVQSIPGSADEPRRVPETPDGDRMTTMTPIRATEQRRHSDSTSLASINFSPNPGSRRSSFSQTSEPERAVSSRTPEVKRTNRRQSLPAIFASTNSYVKPKLGVTRSLDTVSETPRTLKRRLSLKIDADNFRLPRRQSFTKTKEIVVEKMAGMHDVMQNTSIFQIQENETTEVEDS